MGPRLHRTQTTIYDTPSNDDDDDRILARLPSWMPLSVCLSVRRLPICLRVCLLICLSAYLSVRSTSSVCLYRCLHHVCLRSSLLCQSDSLSLCVCLCSSALVCLPRSPYICLCPSVCTSFYLSSSIRLYIK